MRMLNNLKTGVLLAGLLGLFMAIGYYWAGPTGTTFALLLGVAMNIGAYFFSDKIALASMRAQEVTRAEAPGLYDMVERLASRAGLPMPRVYVCPQPAPNAFATGRNPQHAAVAVTQGMLRNFPDHEIEGVLAHELAHVRHRDILTATIAATLAGVITQLAYMLMWFGGGGRDRENPLGAVGALAMIILAPLSATLIQLAISRSREYAADSYGGELCGDPNKLAAALVRLHNTNERIPTDTNPAYHSLYIMKPLSAGSLLGGLFSTHPPTEKRIAALREQAARMR